MSLYALALFVYLSGVIGVFTILGIWLVWQGTHQLAGRMKRAPRSSDKPLWTRRW